MAARLARGEIRLYQFAAPDKRRPVLVLTDDAAMPHLSKVTIAPITSTVRGVPSEVVLEEGEGMKQTCAVNLHNVATVARGRLGHLVARLSDDRMREVCSALRFALGCDQ